MREILFRGRTETGRWVYGSLILTDTYCCILEAEKDVHPTDYPYLDQDLGTFDGRATPVVRETVGQFTGLLDKNGNKIFEGDIVVEESGIFYQGKSYLVEWVDNSCGFEPFSDSEENCGHCGGGKMPNWTTIAGNVHDNPELLDAK